MEKNSVQKAAGVLDILVLITLACNLIALLLVPGLVLTKGLGELASLTPYENPPELLHRVLTVCVLSWKWIWQAGSYETVLALFLLFSGCCTVPILWQARRVLKTILKGAPFAQENAASLRRAAACCFLIAGAALVRVIFSVWYYRSLLPLASYNALFVPMFAMAGLLCRVMSALFRQAAELKAENDLTI